MKHLFFIINLFVVLVTFSQNEIDPANPSTMFVDKSDENILTEEQKQLLNSGLVKYENKNFSGAIFDLTNLINLKPRCLSAYLYRAKAYYDLNDFSNSINDINFCIDNMTNQYEALLVWIYYERSALYWRTEHNDKAVSDVTFAINNASKWDVPILEQQRWHAMRGIYYFNLNKPVEGCQDLKIASYSTDTGVNELYSKYCSSNNANDNQAKHSNSNTSSLSNASSFNFEKPILNITWVDNRKVCCCCNTNMRKYRNEKLSNKESAEFQYILKNLYIYHKNNNSNESTINADLSRLQKFVSTNFTEIAVFTIPTMYSMTKKAFEIVPGYKVGSKNVKLNIYEELNKKCGKCKDDCLYDSECK